MQSIRKLLQLNTIPELATFDTSTRKVFLLAARASWRGSLLRAFIFYLLTIAFIVTLLIYVRLVSNAIQPGSPNIALLAVCFLILPLTFGAFFFFAAHLSRRYLIRRSLRKVLRTYKGCTRCGYILSGIPIDPTGQVVCPECGHVITPELNHPQSLDQHNRTTFQPIQPTLNERILNRTVFQKNLCHLLFTILATAALLLASSYLFFVHLQASRAFSDRNSTEQLIALIAVNQPIPGAHTASQLPHNPSIDDLHLINQWSDFVTIIDKVAQFGTSFAASNGSTFSKIDYTVLCPQSWWPKSAKSQTESEAAAKELLTEKSLAFAALESARTMHLLEQMKIISSIQVAMRPLLPFQKSSPTLVQPLVIILLPELQNSRYVIQLNSARMFLAVQSQDKQEYLAAADQSLAIARILDAQTILIGRLTSIGCDDTIYKHIRASINTYPSVDWISDIQHILLARSPTIPFSHALRSEQLISADTIQFAFAQPLDVLSASLTNSDLGSLSLLSDIDKNLPVGTYAQNLHELNSYYENCIAATSPEPWQRHTALPDETAARYRLTDVFCYSLNKSDIAEYIRTTHHRGILLLLAIRHYQLRTGSLPATLADLTSEDLPSPMPLDPYSGQPFKYKLIDPASDPHHRSFLLYSVGADLTDNDGKETPGLWLEALKPSGAGYDAVINQPVE